MKRKISKAAALILAVVMAMGIFSGCGQSGKTGEGTLEKQTTGDQAQTEVKKIQGTVKFAFPGDPPKAQDEVGKAVEEKLAGDGLDLKLEFTFIPWDQYWNKLALIAAGGEDYDLTWTHITTISDLVAKKALAPLDDALKGYGQDLLQNTPDYVFREAMVDGKVYAIPRTVPSADNDRFAVIRGDLRKKYNLPEIKTLTDMENYFDTIAKNEKDVVPVYGVDRILFREYGNVYTPIGNFGKYPVYIDPADKDLKVQSFYESDIFKNSVNKKNEWYKKGWVPKDDKKVTGDNEEAALNSGKIASSWSVVLKTTERIDGFKKAMPEGELEDVYLNPDKPKYVWAAADNMLSVFSSSSHVNEAVAFVNWFRKNQENFDLFSYGIKDTNYKLDGESVSYDGIPDEHNYSPINWAWNDIRFTRYSKHLSKEYVDKLKNWDSDAVPSPLLGLRFNLEPIKTELAQINAVEGEYVDNAMYGKFDYDSFSKEFIEKLKQSGLEKVIAELQKQVDAFKAKK